MKHNVFQFLEVERVEPQKKRIERRRHEFVELFKLVKPKTSNVETLLGSRDHGAEEALAVTQ